MVAFFRSSKKHSEWTSLEFLRYQFLSAYLEEAYYWGALQAYKAFTITELTHDEYWQTARKFAPLDILKSYNPTHNALPTTYAQVKIKTLVIKQISIAVGVDNASDWGLLKRVSAKHLKEVLEKQACIKGLQLSRYVLAWEAFKAVYGTVRVPRNRPLPAPNSPQLEAMVQYYLDNSANLPPIDVVEIETILKFCIQALRETHKIKLLSTDSHNQTISKQIALDSELEYQDTEDAKETLTPQQAQKLKHLFAKALLQLTIADRKMLILEFGLPSFPQKHIAEEFFDDPQNYRVTRRLQDIKKQIIDFLSATFLHNPKLNQETLLGNFATQEQNLEAWLSDPENQRTLEARLTDYLGSEIFFNLLQKNLLHHHELNQEILFLSLVYGAELQEETPTAAKQEKAFFKQLSQTEKIEAQKKLQAIKQFLIAQVKQWMTIILNCKTNTVEAAHSSIEKLIDAWLPQAPYAILSKKQGTQKS